MRRVDTPVFVRWAVYVGALPALMACEIQQNPEETLPRKESMSITHSLKNLGDNCFRERIVQPPRGKKGEREVPNYFLEGPWAEYLDFETLSLKLNEKDIDYTVEAGDTQIHFSNPGKSRAVIDISYCLIEGLPEIPADEDTDAGSDDGLIVIEDPCLATVCGDVGL
jgi:hypothetical protein